MRSPVEPEKETKGVDLVSSGQHAPRSDQKTHVWSTPGLPSPQKKTKDNANVCENSSEDQKPVISWLKK